jgi:hypothetical protein
MVNRDGTREAFFLFNHDSGAKWLQWGVTFSQVVWLTGC